MCLANPRALAAAWTSYANDHAGLMVNNLTIPGVESTIAAKTYLNWANNVMTWAATGIDAQSTTNLALVATSQLFSYLQSNVFAFKCPADTYLSPPQRQANRQWRTRSYSMNAFMGQFTIQNDPAIKTGKNTYFPAFRQFLQLDSIPNPGGTFVFTEEHPDSINDGFFINDPAGSFVWGDLPASYHGGGCSFAFADGHAESRRWESARTTAPVRYNYASVTIPSSERIDYQWIAARTSVDPTKLATRLTASNQLRIAVLFHMADLLAVIPTNISVTPLKRKQWDGQWISQGVARRRAFIGAQAGRGGWVCGFGQATGTPRTSRPATSANSRQGIWLTRLRGLRREGPCRIGQRF